MSGSQRRTPSRERDGLRGSAKFGDTQSRGVLGLTGQSILGGGGGRDTLFPPLRGSHTAADSSPSDQSASSAGVRPRVLGGTSRGQNLLDGTSSKISVRRQWFDDVPQQEKGQTLVMGGSRTRRRSQLQPPGSGETLVSFNFGAGGGGPGDTVGSGGKGLSFRGRPALVGVRDEEDRIVDFAPPPSTPGGPKTPAGERPWIPRPTSHGSIGFGDIGPNRGGPLKASRGRDEMRRSSTRPAFAHGGGGGVQALHTIKLAPLQGAHGLGSTLSRPSPGDESEEDNPGSLGADPERERSHRQTSKTVPAIPVAPISIQRPSEGRKTKTPSGRRHRLVMGETKDSADLMSGVEPQSFNGTSGAIPSDASPIRSPSNRSRQKKEKDIKSPPGSPEPLRVDDGWDETSSSSGSASSSSPSPSNSRRALDESAGETRTPHDWKEETIQQGLKAAGARKEEEEEEKDEREAPNLQPETPKRPQTEHGSRERSKRSERGRPVADVFEAVIDGKPCYMSKVEMIGAGSFGAVYLATVAGTGEKVAVKEMNLMPGSREDAVTALAVQRELKAFIEKKIKHPHIVRYLGHECSRDKLSIYLEYVHGGSVSDILSESQKAAGRPVPLKEALVAKYTREVLLALEYLHKQGIAHRLGGDE
uniref:Protein kinase domain-containing protein n=1 Tax=Chromera velia CCMP2878 TaxID=1169474 RepID=A0A0G4IAZ0_9ALVE|eukprot:Cvel_12692.t1-p1 / transcript=Cvel_12692.t1 / gene=Cvel_12692 / organism=Chromera_velia_CCMP2878 / gene_product=Mitogen-activated protein kinase kinase kinase NPK1, putative / transcript_product=Mitogen-activated protein kinase kinase kinase NPK1, putative / location=Cvel_scaffold840:10178-12439(-) / protein_length=645 / sequence_SO=supercontig / SO=protein_coding / is_pseudo=false